MSRAEQSIGKAGERLAEISIRAVGVEMLEKIGTPVYLRPTSSPGSFHVTWGEPVSGDYRGILPGGKSVLVEVKTIIDRNLRWSDLREHQPGRLSEHSDLGGVSLLVWVHSSGVYVMRWPVPDFGPGKGMDKQQAWKLNITGVS